MYGLPPLSDILSPSEVNDLMDGFPTGFLAMEGRGKARVDLSDLIVEWGPLTSEDVRAAQTHVEAGSPALGVPAFNPLQKLRQNHHRMAQYLAMGMADVKVAALCNTHPNRIWILKQDPAFKELLAYYATGVQEEFSDFVSAAADLSLDMIEHLRDTLENAPERITPQVALEAIKTLADRSGHAPITKNLNVNVNAGLGDRLRSARERANSVLIEQG